MAKNTSTVWLQTDHPVSAMNSAMWKCVPDVEQALRNGIAAVPDAKRPEFYELEFGDRWYYLHFPVRIPGIFLIAASCSVTEHPFAGIAHEHVS